jgi:hypothetical protein
MAEYSEEVPYNKILSYANEKFVILVDLGIYLDTVKYKWFNKAKGS